MNSPSRSSGFLLIALALLWFIPSPGRSATEAPDPSAVSDSLSYSDAVVLLETRSQHLMAAADREYSRS